MLNLFVSLFLYVLVSLLCWKEFRERTWSLHEDEFSLIWLFCFVPFLNGFLLLAFALDNMSFNKTKAYKYMCKLFDFVSGVRLK